ncbi:MAG: type IV pilus assembly protein PilM [Candidatus Omnitrophica bacterium]|nr:type IV pilus assembly protein PilM [Candidatus Omnitrophota bacterium]
MAKKTIIGLDIGTSSIKSARFARKEDGLHLIKVDLREFPRSEGEAAKEKDVLSALKDMLKGVDIKRSRIILSINCPMTSLKKITAPYMPKAELRGAVIMEAKSHFPFSLEEAFLDFEVLKEVSENGVKRYEVALAVSPKKTVGAYLSLLDKAGISPAAFIPCSYAFKKISERVSGSGGKVNCFLEMGSRFTELLVFKGGDPEFYRKIPVSGSDFTRALTVTLASAEGKVGLSGDEAEELKRREGIPQEAGRVLSLLRAPLEHLVKEIERCFDYYREESGGAKVDSLLLFGAGASLKGLDKYLSKELGMDVRPGNAFEGITVDEPLLDRGEEAGRLFVPAIGAALTEAKGINLLPPEIKDEPGRIVRRSVSEGLAAAAALILLFTYIGMSIQLSNFHKRISAAAMEISALTSQFKEAEAQIAINKMLFNEPYWEDVFKELSNIMPSDIYLRECNMRDKVIGIRGTAVSKEPERSISGFILALEKGIFSSVKLVASRKAQEGSSNEFELKCWLD